MSLDKDSFNNLDKAFELEQEKLKKDRDLKVKAELNSKQFVGTDQMQREARAAEQKRIEKKYNTAYEKKVQVIEKHMFKDFGGSRAEALKQSTQYQKELDQTPRQRDFNKKSKKQTVEAHQKKRIKEEANQKRAMVERTREQARKEHKQKALQELRNKSQKNNLEQKNDRKH